MGEGYGISFCVCLSCQVACMVIGVGQSVANFPLCLFMIFLYQAVIIVINIADGSTLRQCHLGDVTVSVVMILCHRIAGSCRRYSICLQLFEAFPYSSCFIQYIADFLTGSFAEFYQFPDTSSGVVMEVFHTGSGAVSYLYQQVGAVVGIGNHICSACGTVLGLVVQVAFFHGAVAHVIILVGSQTVADASILHLLHGLSQGHQPARMVVGVDACRGILLLPVTQYPSCMIIGIDCLFLSHGVGDGGQSIHTVVGIGILAVLAINSLPL